VREGIDDMRIWLIRLRGWLRERRLTRDIDKELHFHLDMEIEENLARGMSPGEARRVALRDLGGVVQTREAVHDVRVLGVESVWQDLRLAIRNLRVRPGVGLAAAAMLALGIGITTAMFTIVDALVLRPAPFEAPEELALLHMSGPRGGRYAVHPATLTAWQGLPTLAGAEAATERTVLVDVDGHVATREMATVSPGLVGMLGHVQPVRGRLFDATDGRPGADDRVLISEDVWRSLFGRDETVIGKRMRVDREWLTVIGVLPADFRFPSWDTVIWRAVDFSRRTGASELPIAYVRFPPTLPRADALRLAGDAAHAADPATAQLFARDWPVAGLVLDAYYRRAVPLLAGGVLLVFVVLCANVCSLLIANLTARRREFSMRAALGAARVRLLRQAFVENCLIGTLGLLAGAAVAWTLVMLARAYLPEAFLLRTLNPLNVDLRALGVTSLAGIVATLAAGLLPAWLATRVDAGDAMRVSERSGTETRAARTATRTLLVAEIALCCTLLASATLLVRSFINLTNAERGIDPTGIMTAWLSLPNATFPEPASREVIGAALTDRIRRLPGVHQVAWSYGLPPGGGAIHFDNVRSDAPDRPVLDQEVSEYYVEPGFFSLFGIALKRGRTFLTSDAEEVVVVSERMAESLWPGLDPIGREFTVSRRRLHVVGVTAELHHPSLDARLERPEFYSRMAGVGSVPMLSIRCRPACPDVAVVRQQLSATHAAVRVQDVGLLEDAYFEQLARPRATAALAFAFAAIATLAAAGGLFSVLSYAVGRRRREFGIRTALGASPSQVRRTVLDDGMLVVGAGIVLGAGGALMLARALESLQYRVTLTDPVSVAIVLGALGLTTIAASWYPARQASRVDPVMLLREE
jgi:putative ABC transport system permease protein